MAMATETPFVTMTRAAQPATLPMPAPAGTMPASPQGQAVRRWPLTVDDYHRLAEIGVFAPEESVELIDGDVFLLSPIRSRHAACVRRLDDRLRERLARRAIVSVQCPVRLGTHSEPEPDLALLRSRADYYADGHPSAADVLLLIEVMEATPDYDRGVKLALYARSGIAEAWLVDLTSDRVEVHRRPVGDIYTETRILLRGQVLAPQAFPDVKLGVDSLLG